MAFLASERVRESMKIPSFGESSGSSCTCNWFFGGGAVPGGEVAPLLPWVLHQRRLWKTALVTAAEKDFSGMQAEKEDPREPAPKTLELRILHIAE